MRIRQFLFSVFPLVILPAALQATTYEFIANQGTANATVQVLVDDDAVADKIQITVNVVPTPYGDILGLFFNLDPYPLTGLTNSSFSGADFSISAISAAGNTITSAGCGGNNVNGAGLPNFDVGIEFGGCGAPGDTLLLSTTLTMDDTYGAVTLTAASFVNLAVRLQAVGDSTDGDENEGSAKLFAPGGTCIDCEQGDPVVPEPSTWTMLGGGLTALAWLRRRRAS